MTVIIIGTATAADEVVTVVIGILTLVVTAL